MKLMMAALAVTLAIAVTASVFALWPVIADAPWEDEVDRTAELRCEGALAYRNSVIAAGQYSPPETSNGVRGPRAPRPARGSSDDPITGIISIGNPGGIEDYDEALAEARAEIDRYC